MDNPSGNRPLMGIPDSLPLQTVVMQHRYSSISMGRGFDPAKTPDTIYHSIIYTIVPLLVKCNASKRRKIFLPEV